MWEQSCRVVESFNGGGCLGLSGTVSVHNPKVVRASAGSLFRLPHAWNLSFENMVDALRARKIPLVGTSPYAADTLMSWDWSRPAADADRKRRFGSQFRVRFPHAVPCCKSRMRLKRNPSIRRLQRQ